MPAISIQNLSKTFPPSFPRLKALFRMHVEPPVEALRDVSLEVGDGEIFGLIGRNGAGKTTLTKIIATLVQPTSGTVSVKDFDSIRDEVRVRSLIGLATAEERSFYWRLSCEKNMMFFARLYGLRDQEARRRIGSIFERVGLTELADRRFSDISTGNKQKLAVARALLPEPPVLLLDEPTRSLDPLAAAEMRALISSLEGVSILLTSHNLSEIEELCGRVAIISKGELKATDTPDNLRRRHAPVQKVNISVTGISEKDLHEAIDGFLPGLSIGADRDALLLSFERRPDDDLLGRAVSRITGRGGVVADIGTEMPTLLDVLESYE
jgi:ABC-2 type transport system ATP-binding protein